MRGFKFFLLFLFFYGIYSVNGQVEKQDNLFVTGVVCDRDSIFPLRNALCRLDSTYRGVDEDGRFAFEVKMGDTLVFSHVGYVPVKIVVSDTLTQRDYLLGIFMTRDTVLLAEVVVIPRYVLEDYKPDRSMENALYNEKGIVAGAFSPVTKMDREMNRKMQIEKFAHAVENKGHVDVGFGVGVQSIRTIRKLYMSRKLYERFRPIRQDEVDLLKKIIYVEKREKRAN